MQDSADALLSLVARYDLLLFGSWGVMLRAWSLTMQGQAQAELERLEERRAAYYRYETDLSRPALLMFQAEAYDRNGQPEDALSMLDRALAQTEARGDRMFEAKLYQLKGECLWHAMDAFPTEYELGKSGMASVEQSLFRSLDTAREQRAKTIELQAAVSLSRFWLSQGRRHEARELLAPVYDWFTEGFDTPVLQAAQALMDDLSLL